MITAHSRVPNPALFLIFAVALHPAFAGTISSIGTLGGDVASGGVGINAQGTVAGTSFGAQSSAFISTHGDVNWVPGIAGTPQSFATGIGNSGAVIGYSVLTNADGSPFHAFVNAGGVTTDLGTLPGGMASIANGINSSNRIVGSSDAEGTDPHAVVFADGAIEDLGTLGGAESDALAINDLGTVAGWSQVAGSSFQHATEFFQISGLGTARIDLGMLQGFTSSEATSINNAGDVAGWEELQGSPNDHSFILTSGSSTGMMDLGLLPGTDSNQATSINSSDVVVGNSNGGFADPFLWANGSLIDLDSFLPANSGWQLQTANSINDSGLVTGQGIFNGQTLGYVLDTGLRAPSATPEPGALSLLGLGLVAIGCAKRKVNRRRA